MKIIHELHSDFGIKDCAVFCLGVFDGVHRGHQHLIQQANQVSNGAASTVLFSFMHVPKYLSGKQKAKCICTQVHKEKLLARLGVDILIHVPFTEELKNFSAEFFFEYINSKIRISQYVVCNDISFGFNRVGDLDFLAIKSSIRGQTVLCCEKIEDVSSTNIRNAIQVRNFDLASSMLGRPYSIYGNFVRDEYGVLYLYDSSLCLPPPGIYDVLFLKDPYSIRDVVDQNFCQTIPVTVCDNRISVHSDAMHMSEGLFEIVFSI